MSALIPNWKQPSHPSIQEVISSSSDDFTTKSVSKVALKPFALFAKLEFPPCTLAEEPTYATVQIGLAQHLNLNSDLVYINHSCEPSLIFDIPSQSVIAGPNGLQIGQELTFFYPSTEWDMAQRFDCFCNSISCKGLISGAKYMRKEQLEGMYLNPHIRELLDEKKLSEDIGAQAVAKIGEKKKGGKCLCNGAKQISVVITVNGDGDAIKTAPNGIDGLEKLCGDSNASKPIPSENSFSGTEKSGNFDHSVKNLLNENGVGGIEKNGSDINRAKAAPSNGSHGANSTARATIEEALKACLDQAKKVVENAQKALDVYKSLHGEPSGGNNVGNGAGGDGIGSRELSGEMGGDTRRGPTSRELSGEMGGDTGTVAQVLASGTVNFDV